MTLNNMLGTLMEETCTTVVSKTSPLLVHIIFGRCREILNCWKFTKPCSMILDNSCNTCLLAHDFRDPRGIRCGGGGVGSKFGVGLIVCILVQGRVRMKFILCRNDNVDRCCVRWCVTTPWETTSMLLVPEKKLVAHLLNLLSGESTLGRDGCGVGGGNENDIT